MWHKIGVFRQVMRLFFIRNFVAVGVSAGVVLLTLLIVHSNVFAQTRAKPSSGPSAESARQGKVDGTLETESKTASKGQAGEIKENATAQAPINPDATFTPTEEISEDKPVAFPVDI